MLCSEAKMSKQVSVVKLCKRLTSWQQMKFQISPRIILGSHGTYALNIDCAEQRNAYKLCKCCCKLTLTQSNPLFRLPVQIQAVMTELTTYAVEDTTLHETKILGPIPSLPKWIPPITFLIATAVTVFGVPGNLLILVIYGRKKQMIKFFIMILAAVDFSASFIIVPSYTLILQQLAHPTYVVFWWGLSMFFITLSIWILDCIAFEYHRAICQPFRPQWSKRASVWIVITGILWSLIPGFLAWLGAQRKVLSLLTACYVGVSLTLMSILYGKIVLFLHFRKSVTTKLVAPSQTQSLQVAPQNADSSTSNQELSISVTNSSQTGPTLESSTATSRSVIKKPSKSSSTAKSARMLAVVTFFFALCYIPIYFLEAFLGENAQSLLSFTFPNHAVNVFVYSLMNNNFRREIRSLINRRR